MPDIRKLISVLSCEKSAAQKINYLKYAFSGRARRLAYRPVVISVVATSNCTLSCDMCPTHSRNVPKNYKWRQTAARDMDLALFKRGLDMFPEALEVHIIGSGEPLLNKDFFEMVRYASDKRKMDVKTFSNGTTIRPNIAGILESGLDGITVSINGHTAGEFSRMTGMPPKVFDDIVAGTKELIEAKKKTRPEFRVKLSFIIDKTNYSGMPEMAALALRLGADHVFFCNFLPCLYGDLTPDKRVITTSDRDIVEFIRKTKQSLDPSVRGKFDFPPVIDTSSAENRCRCHFEQVRFDGEGNVSSCSMMLLNMEGSGHIDAPDCWNSIFLQEMRGKFITGDGIEELCLYCPGNKGVEA